MHRARPALEALGARVAVIGNGLPSFIEGFREKSGYDGELYTDPKRAAYKALQLRRGVRSTFKLKTVLRAASAFLDGYRQTATRGDPYQQGGVFVIDSDGQIVYRHVSEHAGDHAPIREIERALRRIAA